MVPRAVTHGRTYPGEKMTTGGPTNQPGPGEPNEQAGFGGQPVPPPSYTPPQAEYPAQPDYAAQPGYGAQPGYPTPPPSYGGQPGYPAGAPGFGGFPPAPPVPPATPGSQASGFFQALFDFNFNSYVTPKVVKVLYILLTALLALYVLIATVAGFSQGFGIGLLFLLGGVIGFVVLLALFRISLEFYVAVIKISEDVKELKQRR